MEMEDTIRARLDRACNYNKVLGSNLFRLLTDYESDGQPALNSADKFDLDQLLDPSLNYYELRERLEKHLQASGFHNPKALRLNEQRLLLAEATTDVEREDEWEKKLALELETTQTRASFEAAVAKIAGAFGDADTDKFIADTIPCFKSYFDFISLLLGEAKYTTGAIVGGSAGIGKSHALLKRLSLAKVEYAVFNSYSTPLSMYELLFRNNGKVIVMDDVNNLLKDDKAVAILKAALFSATGTRLITYSSTAKVLEDRELPASFIFTGRIFIIVNEIPNTIKETFQALLSRSYHFVLEPTLTEKKLLVRIVFRGDTFGLTEAQKSLLLDVMERASGFGNAHKYNVRSALRAAEMVATLGMDRAQPLILDLLGCDLKLKTFLLIEDKAKAAGISVQKRVEVWTKTTGYSRRVYFETKARYFNTYYGREAHEKEISQQIDLFVESAKFDLG